MAFLRLFLDAFIGGCICEMLGIENSFTLCVHSKFLQCLLDSECELNSMFLRKS